MKTVVEAAADLFEMWDDGRFRMGPTGTHMFQVLGAALAGSVPAVGPGAVNACGHTDHDVQHGLYGTVWERRRFGRVEGTERYEPCPGSDPTVAAVFTGEHEYFSTGCLHGEHGYCQSMTGFAGTKRPGKCKFCDAQCRCECHAMRPEVSAGGES